MTTPTPTRPDSRPIIPLWRVLLIALVLVGSALAQTAPASLQKILTTALGGRRGTIIVADVATGHLLAAQNLDVARARLAKPGSAVKPFVLLAMLRSGAIRPDETLTCPRRLTIGGQRLDCTHPTGLPPLDAERALAYSCNHYFSKMALRLRPGQLTESLRESGLATPGGITTNSGEPVANAITGTVRLPVGPDEQRLQAIGEAAVEVTPLELLGAYRKLAQARAAQPADPALATVFRGLHAAVDYGMARPAKTDRWDVAGKTGTAASGVVHATHGWFAAIAHAPDLTPPGGIAVVVFLENARGADAAAIAADVFRDWSKAAPEAGGAR